MHLSTSTATKTAETKHNLCLICFAELWTCVGTDSHFFHQLPCILIILGGNLPGTFDSGLPKEGSDWPNESERRASLNVVLKH